MRQAKLRVSAGGDSAARGSDRPAAGVRASGPVHVRPAQVRTTTDNSGVSESKSAIPLAAADIELGPPLLSGEDFADQRDIDAIRSGDHTSYGRLLSRHQERMYAVCFRMVRHAETAADLAQDSMVKIIQGLAGFDGRSKFSTWIVRITMNTCLSHLRGAKLRRTVSMEAFSRGGSGAAGSDSGGAFSLRDVVADAEGQGNRRGDGSCWSVESGGGKGGIEAGGGGREPQAGASVEWNERRERLLACLERLDAEPKAIVVLRDVHGLDYGEIADVLEVPVGTVKSRLFRSRAALRELMEEA